MKIFIDSILHSYSQIFFNKNKWFAIVLILTSFINPVAGFCGLLSAILGNLIALALEYDRHTIADGLFGINAVLTGLGLGLSFNLNIALLIVVVLAAVFSFIVTVLMMGRFSVYGLPVLSIPFLLVSWTFILATKNYDALILSERGIYIANEVWGLGGNFLFRIYEWFSNLNIPLFWKVYLKSLGAVIFQYNLLAGIIIAMALLLYSRIAFTLSQIGFAAGWYFYKIIGGNIAELYYGYIGFNFILTSIAIGGIFLVSSLSSYLVVLLITPLIAIIISASYHLFSSIQLPILALPFNVIVLLIIYALKFRPLPHFLQLVQTQYFSPEKNLYFYKNWMQRFSRSKLIHIFFPFFGERKCVQSHNGEITHKANWRHAWDFVIADSTGKEFKNEGKHPEDFYCFNTPVIAPADGTVEEIIDNIDDNQVGEFNLKNNWGNTIILKHAQGLYSQISHLKKDSCKVEKGKQVKKGDVLALCGNSGRSPHPHLHFQLQESPKVGNVTLDFPFAYYMKIMNGKFEFQSFNIPQKNELLTNIQKTKLLESSFDFKLGSTLQFIIEQDGQSSEEKWEVKVDIYNRTYLYCEEKKSFAYFINDGTLFYFLSFDGDKNSLLYYFYLGSNKTLLGYYQDVVISDRLPNSNLGNFPMKFIEDIIAPFYIIRKFNFQSQHTFIDNEVYPGTIKINSSAYISIGSYNSNQLNFELILHEDKISEFKVNRNHKLLITAKIKTEN